MAGKFNIKVSDDDYRKLQQDLENNFLPGFDKAMEKGLSNGSVMVATGARDKIHNITFKLSSSIGIKKYSSRPGYINFDAGYVKTDKFGPDEDRYFAYHELGTSHEPPKSPLQKSKNENKRAVNQAVKDQLEPYLRK